MIDPYGLSKRLMKPSTTRLEDTSIALLGNFVEKEAADFFTRLGIPVVIGYGLTEAGTVVTVNDLKPHRGDTVGKVVPDTYPDSQYG